MSDDAILDSQRTFYDERAEHYADPTKPSDRRGRGYLDPDLGRAIVDGFAPSGDVLEIACGTGLFTEDLVRHPVALTALDASPRMLAINAERVGDRDVDYINHDIFMWTPNRSFDAVFFGFWLSHVPPSSFDAFWDLVRRCLKGSGRVGFVDEDERAAANDVVRKGLGRRTLVESTKRRSRVAWRPSTKFLGSLTGNRLTATIDKATSPALTFAIIVPLVAASRACYSELRSCASG